MPAHILRNVFNSGVMTPLVWSRLDVEKVGNGMSIGRNNMVRPHGGIFKRSGTERLVNTKNNQVTRLMPFNYDSETQFDFCFTDSALRFLKNGAFVSFAIGATDAWSGTTSSYQIGTWIFNSLGTLYGAKTQHTPSGANEPPSTSWSTTNIKAWAASTAYSLGDFVADRVGSGGLNGFFICTSAHTSSTTLDTSKFKFFSTGLPWATSTAYSVGDYRLDTTISFGVTYRWFRCKVAHTSGATTKPGVGASWTTYWTEYSTIPVHSTASVAYLAGDEVRVGTDIYIAFSNHTSSTTNAPTGASPLWAKLTTMKGWDGTSTSRAVGDIVFYAGGPHICTIAHTSSTYLDNTKFSLTVGSDPNWTATPSYAVNTIVYDGTNKVLYLCILKHDTASTTEPGTTGGKKYWQKLRNIFFWFTATSYVAGQYVFHGTDSYRVVSDHTSGTFSTDLGAGKLVLEPYVLELETPYSEADIFEIKSHQLNDVTWLMHPDNEMMLLTRFGNSAWKLASVDWDNPPMRDENIIEEATITPSATSGDGITLTAARGMFDAKHKGAYFTIGHRREQASVKLVLSATGESTALRVQGRWDIYIYGTTWVGEVVLLQSTDGTNYEPLRNWVQPVANMRSIATSGTTEQEVWLKLKMSVRTAGGSSDYAWLECADSRVTGLVQITSVSSPTIAVANVITGKELLNTTATSLWAEGAFSDFRGWPSCAALHELRMTFAGVRDEPHVIRMSCTDDFYNFRLSALDTSALTYQIASEDSSAIRWIKSTSKILAIGTVGKEWVMRRSSDSKALSPSSPPTFEEQSQRGSSHISAVTIGNTVIHFQNDNMRACEFSYNAQNERWESVDISALSEHLFKSGIKQVAVARQPDPVMFCVLNDGRMLTLTYDRKENVVAWAEHGTRHGDEGVADDSFESVSALHGSESNADEVKFVVRRGTQRIIERLHRATYKMHFDEDEKELCYLDSSVLLTNGSPSTSMSGLGHLEGWSVMALADGVVRGPFTVSGGAITLPVAATKVRAGLPFTSYARIMPVDIQLPDGTSLGRELKVAVTSVFVYESNGFDINSDDTDDSIRWLSVGGATVALALDTSDVSKRLKFPRWRKVPVDSRFVRDLMIAFRSSSPLPVNILALEVTTETYGK